jgi:hypothetical protein
MNNFHNSKFFNTGYIPENSNEKRLKQGLDSQFISNTCLACMKEAKQNELSSFNTYYYPVKATPVPKISSTPIKKDNMCLDNINTI